MLKKYKDTIKKLFQKLMWWQPVLFLLLMFAIGLYTNYQMRANETDNLTMHSTTSQMSEAVTSSDVTSSDVLSSEIMLSEAISGDVTRSESGEGEIVEESTENAITKAKDSVEVDGIKIKKDGSYTSKEEVALYIHTYGKLPKNYITKAKAKERGWNPHSGNLHRVLKGMSIGGDYFSNREGHLPEKEGRKYYECDIDYVKDFRNDKRIVYSDDGLIFYTEDHYESFEQLY